MFYVNILKLPQYRLMFIFLETDSISFKSNSSYVLLLRDQNGNNLLFLGNPCHQLWAAKDIVSYSLVFYS